MDNMTLYKTERNVVNIAFDGITTGWEQWVLLSSDRHHDNPKCDRALELEQLKKAQERNAIILDFGDMFCAMQGRYDPRRSMSEVRPEDKADNYLDLIIQHAAEFYAPFVDNFCMIGVGNHEQSILKNNSVSLVDNLIHRMNTDYKGSVQRGYYGGYVRFLFKINKTKRMARNLYYHHGAGGGGPVTLGVIQTNRQAVYLPDADIIVNGHTHDSWIVTRKRQRLTTKGKIRNDLLWFVRTPGYKDGWTDGAEGFEVETWKQPKPLGAAWLHFYYHGGTVLEKIEMDIR